MYRIEDLHIVIVEPSSVQRHIIHESLSAAGILHIDETATGREALDLLYTLSPDLLISSLYLPDMTGTDLIHQIRESETHADTPFLLISSETRLRYLDPIRQAGTVGILPKPYRQEELETALRTTLHLVHPEQLSLDEAGAGSLRVLIVDDSSMARRHIQRVLEGMEIRPENIDTTENGQQALEMINRNFYDFVVTDYNMPVMDGGELVEYIRNESMQSSIPILMVTSEQDSNRLAAVQQAGVSAICDKPFEPATVQQLIGQFLQG